MKVFATTAIQDIVPGVGTYLPVLSRLAEQDRIGRHHLVEDADAADIILFLDGHQHYRDVKLSAIRNHPLARKRPGRTFLYSELDQPWCAMPGLYVAMPKPFFDARRQRACAYLSAPNQHVGSVALPAARADLLFSFMGRNGNRTRDRILRLSHADAWIEDTTAMNFFDTPSAELERQKWHYADIVARSKFVLCPKGAGPSSYRIFETMAAGRVPVIVSDDWVPPGGPAWDECALFIKERNAGHIHRILKDQASRFEPMAAAARKAWEDWFATDILFHRMVEELASLVDSWAGATIPMSRGFDVRYLRLRARATKWKVKQSVKQFVGSRRPPVRKTPELVSGVD